MDPVSAAASVVGIIGPTITSLQQIRTAISNIADAPATVRLLSAQALPLETVLQTLREIGKQEQEAVDTSIWTRSKALVELCDDTCKQLSTDLNKWTRHSHQEDTLSIRDRLAIGLLKDRDVKAYSTRLQAVTIALSFVVNAATLIILKGRKEADIVAQDLALQAGPSQAQIVALAASLPPDVQHHETAQQMLGLSSSLVEELRSLGKYDSTFGNTVRSTGSVTFGSLAKGNQINENQVQGTMNLNIS